MLSSLRLDFGKQCLPHVLFICSEGREAPLRGGGGVDAEEAVEAGILAC